MNRRRRGLSFVEIMIYVVLASMLIYLVWSLLIDATRMSRRAGEEVALQRGVRNVVESMQKDVSGAMLIALPNGSQAVAPALSVYRYSDPDASQRLTLNGAQGQNGVANSPYPQGRMASGSVHQIRAIRVSYFHAQPQAPQTVFRRADFGILKMVAPDQRPTLAIPDLTDFEVQEQGEPQVMAENVSVFTVSAFGYDPTHIDTFTGRGRIMSTADLPALPIVGRAQGNQPGQGSKMDRTACVVLQIRSEFDHGPNAKVAEDSSMEIVTKFWSFPKIYEHMYRPYFSSVDRDLRY